MMIKPSAHSFVRSHLKTRHLALLVELDRQGSVAQAAVALKLSQPGASKLLTELEQKLGVQLFERSQNGVSPSLYGRVLIRRAGAALRQMSAAYHEVTGDMSSQVDVGSIATPAKILLPPAISLLASRKPGLCVAVSVAASDTLIDRLRAAEYDIVIGRIGSARDAEGVAFEPLGDEHHLVVAGPDHPLLKQEQVELAALADQSWILPPKGSNMRARLEALFREHGLAVPPADVQSADLPFVVSVLCNTTMLAALPVELVQPLVDEGMLAVVPCNLELRMDRYGIITRSDHPLSPAAAAMMTALRDVARAQL